MQQVNYYDAQGKPIAQTLLNSRAFHYADGFFTTIRVYAGQPQLWHFHQQRLVKSASAFFLQLDIALLTKVAFLLAKRIKQGVLKIHVSRQQDDGIGYHPATAALDSAQVYFITKTAKLNNSSSMPSSQPSQLTLLGLQPPIAVNCSAYPLSQSGAHRLGLKTLEKVDQVLAAKALKIQQLQYPHILESLMFDLQGDLTEAISSNVFFQLKNQTNSQQWFTPSLKRAGVAGTLREAILATTTVQILDISKEKLQDISALFLTNAVRGIMPVSTLHDVQLAHANTLRKIVFSIDASHKFYHDLCHNTGFTKHCHDNSL